jgi:hypothetical protein
MIARFASVYVRCLFALELSLFALSFFLHVSVVLGADGPFAEYGKSLFYCPLIVSVPAFGLAEEKNVWKHEFKSCPRWLQIATAVFMIYGLAVASVQAICFSNGGSLEAQPLFASGAPLFLEPMPLFILYSLLWGAPVRGTTLVKRVRISLVGLGVCVAFVVAARLGYLPHRPGHGQTTY